MDDSKLYIWGLGFGFVVVIAAFAAIRRLSDPPQDLGAVSQQWISEHQVDRE